MNPRVRIRQLEHLLDTEDVTDDQFISYTREINQLDIIVKEEDRFRKEAKEAKRLEEEEHLELQKVLALTEEQVDKMYEDSCLKYQDVNGISFRDWYTKSLKYYDIDDKYNVTSRARSINTKEIVPHPTLAQAKLTVLKRITYKFYDHTMGGHEFAWDIE